MLAGPSYWFSQRCCYRCCQSYGKEDIDRRISFTHHRSVAVGVIYLTLFLSLILSLLGYIGPLHLICYHWLHDDLYQYVYALLRSYQTKERNVLSSIWTSYFHDDGCVLHYG